MNDVRQKTKTPGVEAREIFGQWMAAMFSTVLSKIAVTSDTSDRLPETKLLQGSQNVLTSERCFWFLC